MPESLPAVLPTCCSPARRLCDGCLSQASAPGACAALSKGEAWASASSSASATSRGISPIRDSPPLLSARTGLSLGDSPPSTPSCSPAGLLPAHSPDGDVTGAGQRCCSGSPASVASVPSEAMAPTVLQPFALLLLSASPQAHDSARKRKMFVRGCIILLFFFENSREFAFRKSRGNRAPHWPRPALRASAEAHQGVCLPRAGCPFALAARACASLLCCFFGGRVDGQAPPDVCSPPPPHARTMS